MKLFLRTCFLASLIFAAMTNVTFGVTLLTKDQALKEMFPDVDAVTSKSRQLTASEITTIKNRLGGSLVHYQAGSQSAKVAETTSYDFYLGTKNGKVVRIAVIEEQPGKWGPVQFIIAVDCTMGKINNLAVMSYVEKRGRPIALRNFLDQFINKKSSDPISVRGEKGIPRDIRAVSGATISSDCTCFAVKKVLALYEEVYLKTMVAIAQ
jgi:Na+-translocating ferredoxin:NAD+ oxidoreductase RnfG subunit